MKNIIVLIALIIEIISINLIPQTTASAESKYARIENTTPLLKSPSDDDSLQNIYCLAEQSYFVELISEHKDFYRVYYNNINGYIKKTDVKEISNTPVNPYPNDIKLTIGSNCNLRSTPTTKSQVNNVISTIYNNETNITFIGRVIGEEAIDFGGSTWYYVNHNGNYGYIYNNYIKSITPIYNNTEEYTYKEFIPTKIENPITHTPSLIIIILLIIPFIGLLIILYLPKSNKTKLKSSKTAKSIERY